jgi:hypothetical protein
MEEDQIAFLKHRVAEALMKEHGFVHDLTKYDAEFDPNLPDSQYSMAYIDADTAVETFIEALLDIEAVEPEEEPVPQTPLYEFESHTFTSGHEPVEPPIEIRDNRSLTVINSTFIFLNSPSGTPLFVGDVREWLATVDSLGISDSVEVEGELSVERTVDRPSVSSSDYGLIVNGGELRHD